MGFNSGFKGIITLHFGSKHQYCYSCIKATEKDICGSLQVVFPTETSSLRNNFINVKCSRNMANFTLKHQAWWNNTLH